MLSLGRARSVALLVGIVALGAGAACASSEADDTALPPDGDGGASILPEGGEEDLDAEAPAPAKDAGIDAGPKTCSDHGFCPTTLPGDQTVNGLWGDGTGVVWAVTKEGDVLRWDGSAWSVHTSGLGELKTIWGSSPTDIWVGGSQGLQHGTGESSTSLTFASSALPGEWLPPIQSIWGASANDVWAVASWGFAGSGFAFHYPGPRDGGTKWELDPISTADVGFTRVWGGHGTVWLGGGRMSTETWANETIVLYKSGNGEFTELTLPVNPDPKLRDHEKYALLTGAIVSTSTSVVIYGQPESMFVQPSVWRGTSADGGKTFQFTWAADPRRDIPRIHAVAGVAANNVWAVGEYGRLLHWSGTSWAPTAISITGQPVPDPFFAVWTRGSSEIWVGGKGMALRFDPAHAKDGGAQ